MHAYRKAISFATSVVSRGEILIIIILGEIDQAALCPLLSVSARVEEMGPFCTTNPVQLELPKLCV
jgi:hypothetical protein